MVIFDLDGTIALNEHRQHWVDRPVGEKDWAAFFDACDKDVPNRAVIRTMQVFEAAGHDVQIWSGRTDRVRDKTEKWLSGNGLGHFPLRMRQESDRRRDTVLKKEWLDALHTKPLIAFDDRSSVVSMWRENGVPCFQVAEGDF